MSASCGRLQVWQTFLAKGVSGLMVLMPTVDAAMLTDVFETYRQAWQDRVRVLGADHKHTINALSDLALHIDVSGQSADAEPMYREALAAGMRVMGADHPDTINSTNNLASCLNDQRRFEDAEPLYRQALEARVRVLGASHPDTMTSLNGLA